MASDPRTIFDQQEEKMRMETEMKTIALWRGNNQVMLRKKNSEGRVIGSSLLSFPSVAEAQKYAENFRQDEGDVQQ